MMSQKTMAGLGVAACVAACAVSVGLPAMLGAGVIGAGGALAFGLFNIEVIVLAALAAAASIYVFVTRRRKNHASQAACPADASCGCKT